MTATLIIVGLAAGGILIAHRYGSATARAILNIPNTVASEFEKDVQFAGGTVIGKLTVGEFTTFTVSAPRIKIWPVVMRYKGLGATVARIIQ